MRDDEVQAQIDELVEDDVPTRADLRASSNRVIMWIVGAQVAGTGLLLAISFFG